MTSRTMNDLRKAMLTNEIRQAVQQALENGEIYDQYGARWGDGAINILRSALAQPEQESVAYVIKKPQQIKAIKPMKKRGDV